jgi:hypothetical protein
MALQIETSPLPEEVIKLGLGDSPFLVPGEQVQARFGVDEEGDARVVIYVQDIEVRSVDPITKNVHYKVIGLRQYTQLWDVGGSYLDPVFLEQGKVEVDNG